LSFDNLEKLSLEELMNVEVVTASGSKQKIAEAPSTMIVITSAQIIERGYEELDDALRDIPGLDLAHLSVQFPTIRTFRGMYGDENRRILFMIDGIIENSIIGGFEMGGPAYSLHNVERIEIIWGPGSALYGANAFSAVINVVTKKGADINSLNFQKGFGTFNTSFEKLMLGIKRSNLELSLSGSLFSTDGPRYTNRNPQYSNAYVDKAWSFNGIISHTYKKFKTTLGFRAFETPSGLGTHSNSPTQLLGLPSPGNGNTGELGSLSSPIRGEKAALWQPFSRTAFIQNEFVANEKFSVFSTVQYRETGLSDKSYAYSTIDGKVVSKNFRAHYSNRVAGEISATYALNENHKFLTGAQVSQDNVELDYRGVNPDNRIDTINYIPLTNIFATYKPRKYIIRNNIGVYGQYQLTTTFLRRTNLTIGGRYDNNSIYGTTVNPRLGLINQPNEKITFKLLFGTAYRAPTNAELFNTAPIRIPNPDLKPEKIKTYELNFIYLPSKKFYALQTNVFFNDLSNIIVADVPVAGGKTQNQNVGTASTYGLEAKLDIFFAKQFSSFINYTYQDGKQNNGSTEVNMPNIAKNKGNIGFSVLLAERFSVSLVSNWVGVRSVAETNPLGKVDGYFVTNLVISAKKLFDNRVSASFNIRNLFNQTYYDPGIRAADGNLFSTVLEQPGINGLFKITVSIF
jgi:outer membrane receptor for ferrienterochelin and colicins